MGVCVSGDSFSSWIKGFRGPVFPDLEVGSGGIRARCGSVSDWMRLIATSGRIVVGCDVVCVSIVGPFVGRSFCVVSVLFDLMCDSVYGVSHGILDAYLYLGLVLRPNQSSKLILNIYIPRFHF